jgi:hypothetical protein
MSRKRYSRHFKQRKAEIKERGRRHKQAQTLWKVDTSNTDSPHGVEIVLMWHLLDVGASFFVPCINTSKAKREIKRQASVRDYGIEIRCRIENGIHGLRVWRVF